MTAPETTQKPTFVRYSLGELLPEGYVLTFNAELGILSLTHGEKILEQSLLSATEMYVVENLLQNYPAYCPYAVILSVMTGRNIEVCRERVLWGEEEGTLDTVMKPVRNLLGRCRGKVKVFGIDIKSQVHLGYILTPLEAHKRKTWVKWQ